MSERAGRIGVLVAGVVVVVAVLVVVVRWATEERAFTASVVQPPPLFVTEVIPVPAGKAACIRPATLLPRSEVGTLRVGTGGRPPVPFAVTVRGTGGYRQATRIPATYVDNDVVQIRLDPPPEPVEAEICLRNEGRRRADLYAASDRRDGRVLARTRTISRTYVDGRRQEANVQLTFAEARPATIAGRAGTIAGELSVFRPGIVGPWLVWPLAVALILGTPLGLVWAMWHAARTDEDPPPR